MSRDTTAAAARGFEANVLRQWNSRAERRTRGRIVSRLALMLAVLAFDIPRCLASQPETDLPEFTPVQWLPAAASVLDGASVASTGIFLGQGRHQPGDVVTMLAQISELGLIRQWAVVLRNDNLRPEEEKLRSPAFTVYLSNGSEVKFDASELTRMSIQVFGPFTATNSTTRTKQVTTETLVNPEFLGLGLDGTALFWRRLFSASQGAPGFKPRRLLLEISSKPFAPAKVVEHRAAFDGLVIDPAEERAYAGFLPAMMDFFNIARQTRGVREIIFEVADVPWWSLLKKGGRVSNTHFEIIGPFRKLPSRDWGLTDEVSVYSMGIVLRLEGKPTLVGRIAVTAPHPPLLNSAGIVGIAAMRPDGKGPHLMIRAMAGKAAGM